jgi:DNA-binding SARP family transcriptional activator/tetratricopeptide (TPR) repeat protein
MIRLRVLGGNDLRDKAGRELRGIHTQPKRLALLCYLACQAPGAFARRDTLLALFWPELDSEKARNALRQALFHLRKALGDGVLVNRGDEEVGLDAAHFWCDAVAFEAAAAAGRWEDALALYQGDLLPGFFASGAAGFEEWMEERRPALRARAVEGAWHLAGRERDRGALNAAIGWARRATSLSPVDEAGVRQLLALLIQAGDRVGAEQAFQAFARRLEAELGATPAPGTRAILSTPMPVAPAPVPAGATPPAVAPITGSSVGAPGQQATPRPPGPPRGRRALIAAVVLVLAVAVVWPISALFSSRRSAPRLDPGVLFVAPFRVSAPDSSLLYLEAGLVDLLSASLSTGAAPRAVDAGAALRAWDADTGTVPVSDSGRAVIAAWRLGARNALLGHALATRGRLILSAVLLDAKTGIATSVPAVAGPMDSLPQLVDQFAAAVLARLSVETTREQQSLAGVPLSAVRAYLEGRQAFRDGRFLKAAASYTDALEVDSTFALAAMGLAETLDWLRSPEAYPAGLRAWKLRDRLGARNRAVLEGMLGPRYPAATPTVERVAAWERALALAPDRPESWYGLGDVLFHQGDYDRVPDATVRAAQAFHRAIELDSTAIAPLSHLIMLAAREGDTALVRRLAPLAFAHDSGSDLAPFLRWRVRLALATLEPGPTPISELEAMPTPALVRLVGWSQLDGVGLQDADSAAALLLRRAGTTADLQQAQQVAWSLAWAEGRVTDVVRQQKQNGAALWPVVFLLEAADTLGVPFEAPIETGVRAGRLPYLTYGPNVTFWKMWRGEPSDSIELRRMLRMLDEGKVVWPKAWQAAGALMVAARLGAPDLAPRMTVLDTMYGTPGSSDFPLGLSLVAARAHEFAGDLAGARAAISRRSLEPVYGPVYLAGYLYHEGRLALLAGDRDVALRAWRHYLALRRHPDPELRPQVARVRALVDSLEAAGRR